MFILVEKKVQSPPSLQYCAIQESEPAMTCCGIADISSERTEPLIRYALMVMAPVFTFPSPSIEMQETDGVIS